MSLTDQVLAHALLLAGELNERQQMILEVLWYRGYRIPAQPAAGRADGGGLQGGFYRLCKSSGAGCSGGNQ